MAGKPRGPGARFVKGQSGNAKGSSKLAKTRAKLGLMTREEFAIALTGLLRGKMADIPAVARNEEGEVDGLEGMLAMCLVNCAKKGNVQGFLGMIDRVIGKPKETHEVTGADGQPIRHETERVTMTYEEKLERLAQLRRQREAAGEESGR